MSCVVRLLLHRHNTVISIDSGVVTQTELARIAALVPRRRCHIPARLSRLRLPTNWHAAHVVVTVAVVEFANAFVVDMAMVLAT